MRSRLFISGTLIALVLVAVILAVWLPRRTHVDEAATVPLANPENRPAPLADLVQTRSDKPHPVLIVGWDGADWELLDPMLAADRLPNLASLIHRGASADLWSLKPMISPLIWTSVATGYLPDVHGILDFVRSDPQDGHPVPVTSADRKVPALWNIFSDAGFSVGVVAWWATWPAEKVNGVVVSDRVAYQLGDFDGRPQSALVSPPEAWDWLRTQVVIEDAVDFESIARFVHIEREEFDAIIGGGGGFEDPVIHLRRLLASTQSYHRMTLETLRRLQPKVMFTYVEGTFRLAAAGPRMPRRGSAAAAARSLADVLIEGDFAPGSP